MAVSSFFVKKKPIGSFQRILDKLPTRDQEGTFFLLNFKLLTKENGEIIKNIVKDELMATGIYELLKKKIKYIMSDTSASQIRGNQLLVEELGGDVTILRCVMHTVSLGFLQFFFEN